MDFKTKYMVWNLTSYAVNPPVLHERMQCLVYQQERCPTTQRLHWQGCFKVISTNGGIGLSVARKLAPDCNLIGARGSWDQCYTYCTKLDSRVSPPVVFGTLPKPPGKVPSGLPKGPSKLDLAIAAIKEGASLDHIKVNHTVAYVRNSKGLADVISAFKLKIKPEYTLDDYITPSLDLGKCCVIIGPADTGKTQFALAHFKCPLIVRHIDDLKNLGDEHDGIVFDDMSFLHYPRTAQIHLTDWDLPSSINVKFGTAQIPAKMPRIFTSNTVPLHIEDPSIKRRINVYDMDLDGFQIKYKPVSVPSSPSSSDDEIQIADSYDDPPIFIPRSAVSKEVFTFSKKQRKDDVDSSKLFESQLKASDRLDAILGPSDPTFRFRFGADSSDEDSEKLVDF